MFASAVNSARDEDPNRLPGPLAVHVLCTAFSAACGSNPDTARLLPPACLLVVTVFGAAELLLALTVESLFTS